MGALPWRRASAGERAEPEDLAQHARDLATVTALIDDISEQTNLLVLNAAIAMPLLVGGRLWGNLRGTIVPEKLYE